jgi:DNA-binding IclR family transcriptional regulator
VQGIRGAFWALGAVTLPVCLVGSLLLQDPPQTGQPQKPQENGKNTIDLAPRQMLRTKQYWLCAGAVCFSTPAVLLFSPIILKLGMERGLADHGEMGLMEISTALGLHKSTVHRLLMSLVYMGYAKQDEVSQKYMLSYKIVSMAGKMLDRMDILQVAKPYMERLSDISGETVHLVQREGNNILYIYKIEAKIGTIRMVSHVGMVHPMYCSGVGKAIMAELPESEVKQIWNESIIEKKTEHTITDYDDMLSVLKEAKKNGYALDDEENEEGVRCIAASLRDYHNEVKYAFSISGPTSRMTRERVEELSVDVRKVQEELSMELGWYRK